jgi:hypothetical protein
MTRRGLCLVFLVLAACGGPAAPIPEVDLDLRVIAEAEEVVLGKAFPLTVVRVWSKGLEPVEFDEAVLAPLEVRLESTSRREDDRRIEETRRYLAWAFTPGTLRISGPTLRARPHGEGPEREVAAGRLTVRVRGELDPEAPGEPELPGGLMSEPLPWTVFAAGGAAVLAALGLLVLKTRRRSPETVPAAPAYDAPPTPAPHERALARIAGLRGMSPESREEILALHVEVAALLREYLAERYAVPTVRMTTEECLLVPPIAPRSRLEAALRPCDLVKFGRHLPSAAEREETLAAAEGFVRASAVEEEGATP